MRAVVFSSFGDPPSVLELGERPEPTPGPGQVRVKMTRSAIHNHDLWTVKGSYGTLPALPAVGGSEAAGVVDALGDGVTNLKVGDRVAAFGAGTWAEHFLTSAAAAVPLPPAISDDQAGQLLAMPVSALALLEVYGVKAPDFLAQNAANGAVGKAVAKVAQRRGLNVVNLVRSAAGMKELADHGLKGVDTSKAGWRDEVRAMVGDAKIRCAVDSVGGAATQDLASLLSTGGKLVVFGSMSGEPMQLEPGPFIFKQCTLEGFWLSKQSALGREQMMRITGEVVKLVAEGALELPVAGVFPLAQARDAAKASQAAARGGKVLFSP